MSSAGPLRDEQALTRSYGVLCRCLDLWSAHLYVFFG